MAMLAYLDDGRSVSLNTEIGRGAEGAIYASPRDPLECAKIYLKPISAESLKKLTLMVANPPPDPTYKLRMHRSICWPTALLYTSPSKAVLAGFLMPKLDLKSFWKALLFMDPQDRTARFGGGFTWKHLVTSATNIASAVAAIHEQGYCIGDLNESNVLIAPNALASVIDCDSFQVRDSVAGKTYRSPVGKPEYTAPELTGKRFEDVDRTIASDSFALAVLLFQLLMQGTHPFQAKGRLVEDASSTEAKILLGHFPYGSRGKEIAPPDHAPPFEILHPEIRKLFERCFKTGHARPDQRPTAREWFLVLRSLDSTFRQCAANANHLYFDHLRCCPWCEIESRRGRDPFPSPVGQQVALDDSANLLDSLEKRLGYLHPYIVMAFADGVLTSEEESQLMALGKKLQIPPKEIDKSIQAEAVKVQGKRGKAPGSPEITVSRTSFEFNDIRQGTSLTGRYTITNSGGGTLTGAIRSTKSWAAPSQGAIDASRHIQEHTFIVDTAKLTLGTRNHAAIEITSNAGSARIDISVSVELEKVALLRWRKQLFWAGIPSGLIVGLGIYFLMPPAFSNSVTRIAGIVGWIALVVVCAVAGKWGGAIGGFFLAWLIQAVSVRSTMLGFSAVAWAEIVSAFLFFWAKPLLIARLTGNRNTRTWAAASGIIVVLILIGTGVAVQRSIPQPVNLGPTSLPLEDTLAGSTVGAASGVQWANEIGNRGAVFSAANASRIEYPGIIPPEGTLEFWIKVNGGYHYQNFQLQTNQDSALVFSSDAQGGDVIWPGTTKFSVSRDGILSYWMATSKYDKPHAVPTNTRKTKFRFGEWHAIGLSYGRQGQYIMLDGKVMASSPDRTQTFGAAGNHLEPLDIPTIGETVSHFWARHRFEGGFDGSLAAFRVSARQNDWLLAQGIKRGKPPNVVDANETHPTLPYRTGLTQTSEQLLQTAEALFARRQYNDALTASNKVLEVEPRNQAALQLRSRIGQTMEVLGIEPQGSSRSSPTQPAVDCETLYLRLYNVDDQLQASITNVAVNSETILSASEREDTGFVDIGSRTRPGINSLSLKLTNYRGGYTYGYQLRSKSRIIDQMSCGSVGVVGCNNNDFRLGVVFTHTFSFQCADTSKAGASETDTRPQSVYRVGAGVSAPSVLYKQEPTYTDEARAAKVSGTVLLYVEVDSTGRPRNVKVLRGLGLGLDERAIEAVSKWRFRPGQKGGQPVTVAAEIAVDFRLL
jgi:TonB family protein